MEENELDDFDDDNDNLLWSDEDDDDDDGMDDVDLYFTDDNYDGLLMMTDDEDDNDSGVSSGGETIAMRAVNAELDDSLLHDDLFDGYNEYGTGYVEV